jgi:hypothetical protein
MTEEVTENGGFPKNSAVPSAQRERNHHALWVVNENGMELELCYDGLYFPDYRYSGDTILTIAATDRSLPEIPWILHGFIFRRRTAK